MSFQSDLVLKSTFIWDVVVDCSLRIWEIAGSISGRPKTVQILRWAMPGLMTLLLSDQECLIFQTFIVLLDFLYIWSDRDSLSFRLTPPYMLFLMFYVPLFKYWSNGPFWPQMGVEIDECKDSWWQNLLYINNLIDSNKMVRTLQTIHTAKK